MDIVIPVKPSIRNQEELRYTLRCIEANWPVDENGKEHTIWLFGQTMPQWAKDIHIIRGPQHQDHRERTGHKQENLWKAAKQMAGIWFYEEMAMFHDDHFILKPIEKLPVVHGGAMSAWVKNAGDDAWSNDLKKQWSGLNSAFTNVKFRSGHYPQRWNKDKLKQALEWRDARGLRMWTGLEETYGAMHNTGGVKQDGSKWTGRGLPEDIEDRWLVSTEDSSFYYWEIGKYIKQRYTKPSRWEAR